MFDNHNDIYKLQSQNHNAIKLKCKLEHMCAQLILILLIITH